MRVTQSMALLLAIGCSTEEAPLPGALQVCLADSAQEPDVALEIVGDVVALDDGGADCTHTLTIEDDEGVQHTVGLSVTDGEGLDATPSLDLAVGDSVSVSMYRRMVFGSVEGLVIEDDSGLVLAADEGSWGGALDGSEPAIQVDYSAASIYTSISDCLTTDTHEVELVADSMVTLIPFSTTEIALDGAPLTAYAVNAVQYSDGTTCSVSDKTDVLSWLVVR